MPLSAAVVWDEKSGVMGVEEWATEMMAAPWLSKRVTGWFRRRAVSSKVTVPRCVPVKIHLSHRGKLS